MSVEPQYTAPTDALLCPFCGVVPEVWQLEAGPTLAHQRDGCPLSTLWFTLEHWNTRAATQASEADVERVARAISEAGGASNWDHALECARAAIEAMSKTISETNVLRKRYDELLYSVSCKYEGEARHETALRYIREREASDCGGPAIEAMSKTDGEGGG